MGTSVFPMQAIVQAQRDNPDEKQSIKEETNSQSAKQKAGQDNLCVRGDEDCVQGTQGQQITGKDNSAKGFNDQSANVQTPGVTPTPTPTTGTLNVCKQVFSPFDVRPSDFTFTFTSEGASPSEFPGSEDCTKVTVPEGSYSFMESGPPFRIFTEVSGDCTQDAPGAKAFHGSIKDWRESDLHG